ncbi:MAG: sensor domain-containing diguanylate cyclase [Desulfobacterales bacterium]|jgi:diguanylate cyclase (GGDEF)-like protein/PAS domain S-box-containing protein
MLENASLYRAVLDNVYDGVYFLDRKRKIFFWSKGAERITGYASDEVLGRRCADDILCHVDKAGRGLCKEACPAAEVLTDGQRRESEVYLLHKNGFRKQVRIRVAPIEDADGRIVGVMEIFSDDVTPDSMRRRIALLEKLTALDPLTHLPNRRSIEATIVSRLAETYRYQVIFGILFIDIDHFKSINDRHGHEIGDRVLQVVAETLTRSLRPFDLAGRWGGEEFLAVVLNVDAAQLGLVAERVRALIAQTRIPLEDGHIKVTVSIGAALSRADDAPTALVDRADRLMYRSKMAGRNQVHLDTEEDP